MWWLSALIGAAGCNGALPLDEDASTDAVAPKEDATAVDATLEASIDGPADVTVGSDANDASDASVTDAISDATAYHDFTVSSFWDAFDLTLIGVQPYGFAGTTFDGRYVYFGSNYAVHVRYDTTASFTSPSSWTVFDIQTNVDNLAYGFDGVVFDGRYVYFVPGVYNSSNRRAVRYDTLGSFTSASSWEVFNLSAVSTKACAFHGGTFDGKYVYFVPNQCGVTNTGVMVRYDTTASFTTSGSWSAFDLTTVAPDDTGYGAAAFDGQYVYVVPLGGIGAVARYDTTASFTASSSWQFFYATGLGVSNGYYGAQFDGRYIYLAPFFNGSYFGTIVRYDTVNAFTSSSSWSLFNLTAVDGNAVGFTSGTFDGRYSYLTTGKATGAGVFARYDSKGVFDSGVSWQTYANTAATDAGVLPYASATFDGRYVYYPSANGTVVKRFDAKTPASMPSLPQWHGSFY